MKMSSIPLEVPESRLKPLIAELQESIKSDCGTEYSEAAVRSSVVSWLHLRVDQLFEDAVERLTSPSWDEARDFARMLDEAETKNVPVKVQAAAQAPAGTIFSGNRAFSLEKMAAMISHIASATTDLYKTKLNKLLFYADFINYNSFGHSISGSRYVHLPYGPVPDGYEDTLDTLNHYGVIDVLKPNSADLVRHGRQPGQAVLDGRRKGYARLGAGEIRIDVATR